MSYALWYLEMSPRARAEHDALLAERNRLVAYRLAELSSSPLPKGQYRGRIVNGEFRPPKSHLEARMNAQTAACGGVDHE